MARQKSGYEDFVFATVIAIDEAEIEREELLAKRHKKEKLVI